MTPFRLARLDLTRHPAASLLAVLSLAFAIACAGLLSRAWNLAESRFGTLVRTGDAIVGAKADPVDMVLSALNLEGAFPGFIPLRFATLLNRNWLEKDFSVHVTPIVFCGKYRERRVIGTSADILQQPKPSAGFALSSGVWSDAGPGLVVGAATAIRENLRLGDWVSVTPWTSDTVGSSDRDIIMRVVGILKPMGNVWDEALFTNVVQAQRLLGRLDPEAWNGDWSDLVLHYLLLHVPEGGMDHVRSVINERTVTQVASISGTIATMERFAADARSLGLAVILLALCLAAIAIAALLLGRFEAQSRQLATLEAMGYARSELLALLAWQGALLGLMAVLVGAALEAIFFPVFRGLLGSALPAANFVLWQSWPVWCAALTLATAASVFSAVFIFRGGPSARLRALA